MKKILTILVCVVTTMFAALPGAAEVSTKLVSVDLETPGNLGVEILYQVDNLSDVTRLRVAGEINSTDWTTIGNLNNIVEIDLENAITETMPASTFDERKSLVSVKLPKTLVEIGNRAFYSTSIKEIVLPATLNTMGSAVFCECDSLKMVTFSMGTEIKSIPTRTFYSCSNLSSINLPESITSIGIDAFKGNHNLSHIDLPANLELIAREAFEYCGLKSIIIPRYVSYLGEYAFYGCSNLQEVELPTSLHSFIYSSAFYGCNKIKKVICKSPTPPSISNKPFEDKIMSQATLIVPDFAVPDYKLDSYWLGFGKIEGGAQSDYWDIAGAVSFINDRRPEGNPSITIRTGGRLNVSGNSALPMDKFKMDFYQDSWNQKDFRFSRFINTSPLVSANDVEITYSIYYDRWHFIALPFDVNVDDIVHSDATAEFAVRYYDGATRATSNKTGNSWKNVPAGTVIKAGTGFIIQSNKRGDVKFPCVDDGKNTIFNPNSLTLALEANEAASAAHSGWNLVANPYPCYYDMYYSALSCPITVYNTDEKNYTAYSLIDDEVVLWPNRPFFIQATDDVKEIVFSNLGRQFFSDVNRRAEAPSRSSDASSRMLYDIALIYGAAFDATRVVVNPDASTDYEISRDASKFLSDNKEIPQIYTISAEEEYLAINERNQADGIVRLGFYAPEAGEMSLSLNRCGGEAAIYDAETGNTTNLTEGEEYHFMASEAGFDNSRFTLVLGAHSTGIDKIAGEEPAEVSVIGNVIRVLNANGKEVVIASADGKVIVSETAGADTKEYSLPCGLYIVRAGGSTSKCIIK